MTQPRYPVYVISKGRWESRLTVRALEEIGVPYHVVVEPQEFEQYASLIDPDKVLALPFSNLGQGSIPARNWVWQHSLEQGAERHWIMDDNIRIFYRFNRNQKTPVADGTILRCVEDFTDRYDNVAESGLQYAMFVTRKKGTWPAVVLNTRVYSCILINNALPFEEFKWRGRYNEDTDLSLRCLKAGWATFLFNAFLADKIATGTMKGGNTDELYASWQEDRMVMAQSLVDQHPDVVRVVDRWGRPQHMVDYRRFKDNNPQFRGAVPLDQMPAIDNYGMTLEQRIGGEWYPAEGVGAVASQEALATATSDLTW